MTSSDSLVDAARKLLDELLPYLERECPKGDDRPLDLAGLVAWKSEGEIGSGMRRYKALPRVLTADQQCAARTLGDLRQARMEPLMQLEGALAADPTIGPRLDHAVASAGAGGGGPWQAASLTLTLVDEAIAAAGGFDLDRAMRDSLTTRWTDSLRRLSDQVTIVVTLDHFDSEEVPIRLGQGGLEIDELSETEISAALTLGAGARGPLTQERIVSRVFGVRGRFESPLFIDSPPSDQISRDVALREETRQHAELALLALRIFKAGAISSSGSFEYSVSWAGELSTGSGSFSPTFGWVATEPYLLTQEEVPRFREFWSGFFAHHTRRETASAIRRFSYAADRTLPLDSIVDLMIAAESLFLSEMDEKYRGELSYRLATRAASLLGTTLEERLRLYKFMRRAYDARSVIVHGGTPDEADLRTFDGGRSSVETFATELEEVVREALKITLAALISGEPFPPDWEGLLFALPDG
jgi:hypothetical protein